MIVCENCGANDDEAMNMNWTMGIDNRDGRIKNIDCKRCGSHSLLMVEFLSVVIILEEWEPDEMIFAPH